MEPQTDDSLDRLTERYAQMWNISDTGARVRTIRELFADDAIHVAPSIVARGYEELEARVMRSHQRWVVEENCRFRSRGGASGHHNVARFTWEMIGSSGSIESVGTEILVFNDGGKIASVYQFIDR